MSEWEFSPQQAQQRLEKNLSYFKQHLPSVFEALSKTKLETHTLSLNTDKRRVDLFDRKRTLYLGDAEAQIDQEVDNFCAQFSEFAPLETIQPANHQFYVSPRFFHSHLRKTIQSIPMNEMDLRFHYVRDSLPMVVFTGVGTGLHIQKVLEKKNCQVVIVHEHNMERLLISCYLTDWYKIIADFEARSNGNFSFNILPNKPSPDLNFKYLWNNLVRYAPLFPTLCVFYNHLKDANQHRMIELIQTEFKVFITAWGFYDDEINQFNNARHNLSSNIPVLPKRLSSPISEAAKNNVAVIVGAGPSLNERIEWIKKNRSKIILFSAGTALSILKHHNITPDIQVEIESDYATVLHLSHTLDEDYQVPLLVGAVQLNPLSFNFFDKKLLFFKDSTPLFELFGKHSSVQLIGMTPTCTNAATSLAIQIGFKKICFFGMDFGYEKPESSHAKGSVYFKKDAPKFLTDAAANRTAQMTIESVFGNTLLTEPIYNAARDRIEKVLEAYGKSLAIYNCSTGAKIQHTSFVAHQSEFEGLLPAADAPPDYSDRLYYESVFLPASELESAKLNLQSYAKTYAEEFINDLKQMDASASGIVTLILKHIAKREASFRKTKNALYYLFRGTVWHYLYVGLSTAHSNQDNEMSERHIQLWKERFIDFFEQVTRHIEWMANRKDTTETDGWLKSTIRESVPDEVMESADENSN